MQKHVNLVDLVKSFPTDIYLQNLASIQKRTSPLKFDHLAEKSAKGSISNFSTKVASAAATYTAFRSRGPSMLASGGLKLYGKELVGTSSECSNQVFDPLELGTSGTEQTLAWFRHAEFKPMFCLTSTYNDFF